MSHEGPDDQLETVATFPTAFEAELAKDFLGSKGIPVYFADEVMARIASHQLPTTGHIRIQVSAAHANKATELLESVDI